MDDNGNGQRMIFRHEICGPNDSGPSTVSIRVVTVVILQEVDKKAIR